MQVKEITWKDGFRDKGVAPGKVAAILNKLPAITPSAVLEEASKPRSPMHKLFEWDDTKAAQEFRLNQARRVIGSLEVTYEKGPDQPVRHLHVTTKAPMGDTRYLTTVEILSNPDTRNDLLLVCIRDLQAFRRKFSAISELANLIETIDAEIQVLIKAVASD